MSGITAAASAVVRGYARRRGTVSGTTMFRRRSYSFFSSKGNGNGRYFTGNNTRVQANNQARPTPPVGDVKAAATTTTTSDIKEEVPKETMEESQTPQPLLHPNISPRDLLVHQFFSLHRPLLTLSSTFPPFASPPPASTTQAQEELEELEHDKETQADSAALTLMHSLTTSSLSSSLSFHSALAKLGLNDSVEMQQAIDNACEQGQILLDSTKRKKRKKMSKHKLKKRRKLQREERRRMGK